MMGGGRTGNEALAETVGATESAKPHQAPGATLFGARLLAQWVDSIKG